LNQTVNAISSLQEGNELLSYVQRQGAVRLQWSRLGQDFSNACWNGSDRIILLNASVQWSEGKKIRSVLFELLNAAIDSEYERLDQLVKRGQISKSAYVGRVEKLEYENLQKANTFLKKGIEQGLFPRDAYFPVSNNFNDHLNLQMGSGHSDFIYRQAR
jgi:hypothetical protein